MGQGRHRVPRLNLLPEDDLDFACVRAIGSDQRLQDIVDFECDFRADAEPLE